MQLFGCYTSGPGGNWNPNGGDATKNADWEAGVRAFGKNVGHDVNCVNVFPCWGSMNDWPGNLAGIVQGVLKSGYGKNMSVVVGLKMFSQKNPADHGPNGYQWNDGAGYADVASGKWDNVWQGIVKALAGLPYAIIRFSDEYNGSFMEDFMGWDANAETAWIAGFNRGASVMTKQIAASGLPVEICLNPDIMVNCPGVSSHAPDVSNFSIIAADWYNGYWDKGDVNKVSDRIACWETPSSGFGLTEYLSMLKSTGKKAFFAECGSGPSSNGAAHGIANDPAYWPHMADVIKRIRVQGTKFLGMCVWDLDPGDGGWKFSDGTQPQCLADFKANIATFVGDDTGGATVQPAAAPAPMTAASFPDTVITAWAPDKLTLMMAGDNYQGDPQFSVSVDGEAVGGVCSVKASHAVGQSQPFSLLSNFGTAQHTVAIQFLNDAWGGTAQTDRNLYLMGATVNGVAIPGAAFELAGNGTKTFTFTKGK